MFNVNAIVGQNLISAKDGQIGIITDAYKDGSIVWAVIDDDYELDVTACEFVVELTKGFHFIRIA